MQKNENIPQNELFGGSLSEIESALHQAFPEVPKYRAKQVYKRFYAQKARSFDEMKELPIPLRAQLSGQFHFPSLALEKEVISEDGTRKFLFRLSDGFEIETVLIPSEMRDAKGLARRKTVCVSTQVGCPLDCKFCATASMKLKRNLTTAEILLQCFEVERITGERITNVVYMGMGEPMLNLDNVIRSLRILTDPELEILGAKRITVSTSGLPDEIRRFADEDTGVKLALSLHATTDDLRSKLMPINKRYPLKEILSAMEYYYQKTHIPVTYEYILFEGLNDSEADAKRLAKITRRMPSKVNVIPFHKIDFTHPEGISAELHPAAKTHFDRFISGLQALGTRVMVRSSSGEDIEAACGQLALSNLPHVHEVVIL
jgi:23S rRNA (adenine2503-C2)-methyltransferase